MLWEYLSISWSFQSLPMSLFSHNVIMDRDLKASRNILIKCILESLCDSNAVRT